MEALQKFNNLSWDEYLLSDLFEVRTSKKRFDANKVVVTENCGFPYVVRISSNNGIRGFILEDENNLNPGNTISFGQDTATIYYQANRYFTGDKIKVLFPKLDEFNSQVAMFMIPAMNRAFSGFSWGSSRFNVKILESQKIKLPVFNGEIDFGYLTVFISAIQKLVIKDVVEYAASRLKATREAIG